jgi:hypothetical protein
VSKKYQMQKSVRITVRFLAVMVLCVAACAPPPEQKASALRSIEQFHNRFNDFRFSEVYDDAGSQVRMAMSREEFVESMKAMREGQGRVLKSEEIASAYDSSPDAISIKIRLLVTFEKGQAREEFLYHVSEGKVVLAGYHFLGK